MNRVNCCKNSASGSFRLLLHLFFIFLIFTSYACSNDDGGDDAAGSNALSESGTEGDIGSNAGVSGTPVAGTDDPVGGAGGTQTSDGSPGGTGGVAPSTDAAISIEASVPETGIDTDGAVVDEETDGGEVDDETDSQATVPFSPGEPIEANANSWTYVHFPNTKCRDGNETGLGINLNPESDKLIIYMEGGGACFNALTCLINPVSWGEINLGTPGGVLSRTDENNIFRDWNMIYIPFCTGDVFSGASTVDNGYGPMQGYLNVGEYLSRIVPTFPDITMVILSGSSAGGFGVAWNWLRTQEAFGDIPVHVLDDSGPPLASDVLVPCLQKHMGEVWNWNETVHPACADCDIANGDVVVPLVELAMRRHKTQRFALLSYDEDTVIKMFFGFGQNDCADIEAMGAFPAGVYPQALMDLMDKTASNPNFAGFLVEGAGHTFLFGSIAGISVAGVSLTSWIEQFVTDGPGFVTVLP